MALLRQGWRVSVTTRSPAKAAHLQRAGFTPYLFDAESGWVGDAPDPASFTHLLLSIPPGEAGDPVLARLSDWLARTHALRGVVYLSTTGVYGDSGGAWVDETSPLQPENTRQQRRVDAEAAWMYWVSGRAGVSLHILRLAGIYGPGRNALASLRDRTAHRIALEPPPFFSRIHVDDIVQSIEAVLARDLPLEVWNLCDDLPAPTSEVLAYAAQLMGVPLPDAVPLHHASVSEMARSFYGCSRRTSNRRLKEQLGIRLRYPTYREGLTALWHAMPHS